MSQLLTLITVNVFKLVEGSLICKAVKKTALQAVCSHEGLARHQVWGWWQGKSELCYMLQVA
jgi:hypothetical protein